MRKLIATSACAPASSSESSRCSSHCPIQYHRTMEGRERTVAAAPMAESKTTVHYGPAIHPRRIKVKNNRSLSPSNSGRRLLPASYFSLESLFLLIGLTASLLILPLILPPLPPPPFMLLLLPIGIMGVLMVLAFMPFDVADLTHKCT